MVGSFHHFLKLHPIKRISSKAERTCVVRYEYCLHGAQQSASQKRASPANCSRHCLLARPIKPCIYPSKYLYLSPHTCQMYRYFAYPRKQHFHVALARRAKAFPLVARLSASVTLAPIAPTLPLLPPRPQDSRLYQRVFQRLDGRVHQNDTQRCIGSYQ